jgi:hypothetical protein
MRKIHPLQAIHAGWIRYSNKAGMYSSFTIMTILISLVLTSVASGIGNIFSFNSFIQGTVVAILVGVVGGIINIGYAHFAAKDESGDDVEFGDFFLGFSENVKSLMLVLIATALVSQLSVLSIPKELQNLNLEEESQIQNLEELTMLAEEFGVVFWDNIGSILTFLAIQCFLGIVLMFAPFTASLEKQDAIQALRFSIVSALPNFFNILFAYLIIVLAIALCAFLLSLLGAAGLIILMISSFIGLFIFIPVLNLIAYDMFSQLKEN